MTAEDSWAHMVLARLSKDQYKLILKRQRRQKGKIYPEYNTIRLNKPNWMPSKADFQAKSLYTSHEVRYPLEQPTIEFVFLAYFRLVESVNLNLLIS